jgi:hypothetical protein
LPNGVRLVIIQGTVNGVDVVQGLRGDGDEVRGSPTSRDPTSTVTSDSFVETLLQAYRQVVTQWGNKFGIPDCTKKGGDVARRHTTGASLPFFINVCFQC